MATGTLGTTARDYHTRQTMYVGGQTLSSAVGGNFTLGTNFKLGTIPAGASVRSILCMCKVADNSAAPLVILGTSAGGAQLFASAASGFATAGFTSSTVVQATGNVLVAADTDIWLGNNSSAASATSGQCQFFVEFVVP